MKNTIKLIKYYSWINMFAWMQEATMTKISWLLHSFQATFFKLPSSFCAAQKVQTSCDTGWHADMRTCLHALGSLQEVNKLMSRDKELYQR